MEKWLDIGAALCALSAAVFWALASRVDIPEINQTLIGLTENPAEKFNVAMSTAARWNSCAASAACVSAVLEATSLFWRRSRDIRIPRP